MRPSAASSSLAPLASPSSTRRVALLAALLAAPPAFAFDPPVGDWHFDEANWVDGIADASGFRHPGVARNGARPRVGRGVFDSTPGCISCPHVDIAGDLGVGGASRLTVEAWVRWTIDPRTGTPRAVIASQSSDTTPPTTALTPNAGLFWLRSSGDGATPSWQFGVHVGDYNVFVSSMTPPAEGEWTHVAGVYDGSEARLYINGSLERNAVIAGRVAPMRPEYRMQVGQAPADEGQGVGRRAFTGEIDELRLFTDALDEETLRRSACEAGPPEALNTFCTSAGPLCSSCLSPTLTATRWYGPDRRLDGDRAECRPVRFAIPARIPVVSGSARGGSAVLSWGWERNAGASWGWERTDLLSWGWERQANASWGWERPPGMSWGWERNAGMSWGWERPAGRCEYVADGPGSFVLSRCDDGSVAGALASGDRFLLTVEGGEAAAGPTRVALSLDEVAALPTLRLRAPQDGATVVGETRIDLESDGAPGAMIAAELDGTPFLGGLVATPGRHVLSVTRSGCHERGDSFTTTFTISERRP